MDNLICAFTSLCEEDKIWIDQYLAESERLAIPFGMHFDRCSEVTKRKIIAHPNCVEYSIQDNHKLEFTERHKQEIFNRITNIYYKGIGYSWAMAWDIDETYEKNAREKINSLKGLEKRVDYVDTKWLNLWESPKFIRADKHYLHGHRVKFYNLSAGSWTFDHPITNGCKLCSRRTKPIYKLDLVCLHWGFMTQELRILHKQRWDRIYGKAVGANPYGAWNDACDESTPPTLIENTYL